MQIKIMIEPKTVYVKGFNISKNSYIRLRSKYY